MLEPLYISVNAFPGDTPQGGAERDLRRHPSVWRPAALCIALVCLLSSVHGAWGTPPPPATAASFPEPSEASQRTVMAAARCGEAGWQRMRQGLAHLAARGNDGATSGDTARRVTQVLEAAHHTPPRDLRAQIRRLSLWLDLETARSLPDQALLWMACDAPGREWPQLLDDIVAQYRAQALSSCLPAATEARLRDFLERCRRGERLSS